MTNNHHHLSSHSRSIQDFSWPNFFVALSMVEVTQQQWQGEEGQRLQRPHAAQKRHSWNFLCGLSFFSNDATEVPNKETQGSLSTWSRNLTWKVSAKVPKVNTSTPLKNVLRSRPPKTAPPWGAPGLPGMAVASTRLRTRKWWMPRLQLTSRNRLKTSRTSGSFCQGKFFC